MFAVDGLGEGHPLVKGLGRVGEVSSSAVPVQILKSRIDVIMVGVHVLWGWGGGRMEVRVERGADVHFFFVY